ncbi:MAG: hypothetical protein ACRDAX_03245 [Propionibacteriaceae bacterium]
MRSLRFMLGVVLCLAPGVCSAIGLNAAIENHADNTTLQIISIGFPVSFFALPWLINRSWNRLTNFTSTPDISFQAHPTDVAWLRDIPGVGRRRIENLMETTRQNRQFFCFETVSIAGIRTAHLATLLPRPVAPYSRTAKKNNFSCRDSQLPEPLATLVQRFYDATTRSLDEGTLRYTEGIKTVFFYSGPDYCDSVMWSGKWVYSNDAPMGARRRIEWIAAVATPMSQIATILSQK